MFFAAFGAIAGSVHGQSRQTPVVPKTALLQIIRAEDERRWDGVLSGLMSHANPAVRGRAALAAGRIGNELAVLALISLMQNDKDRRVRSLAAFALGEVESPKAVAALTSELSKGDAPRARIVEALGKIAAALPQTSEAQKKEIAKTILDILTFEARRRSRPDSEVILLALTATLRARPEGAGPVVAQFLSYSDPRIRSDAGNTLARLRAADGNAELRKLLTSDPDPNVRANAARVLGATEDKAAYDGLLDRVWNDPDKRVRISAIRAVAALKDQRAADRLLKIQLAGDDELLELATAIGRLLAGTENRAAIAWLKNTRARLSRAAEVETAFARIAPVAYLDELGSAEAGKRKVQETMLLDWRAAASIAGALGEIAALPDSAKDKVMLAKTAQELLRAMLDYRNSGIKINTLVAVHSEYAIPDVLRALSAFKPTSADSLYRRQLGESDVVVRATAAELLGDLPISSENIAALSLALKAALQEKESNDAALAIIDTLAKYKDRSANEAMMTALDSNDYIVRRKAIEALKTSGGGDFSNRLGYAKTRTSASDYERAISRIGKRVLATVNTNKGRFTIELLPAEAPLNVDNFVQLAKRRYFNGIVFHRVVPNFVIQGGDPRGDGNGGPGYQVRCEINEVPYQRGAVGMALSGKDTGGSQWFVTHAPQPHLDGGYTVFGNVVAGMNVVDNIVRGDRIISIVVTEKRGPKMQSSPITVLEN
ncbi:MAG TPA: peptidylprolyl isomerase [Pyrinomonadaceae bacterium]|nr:peptidylprolyl isomerase [Pyrinomonadaceae bacterium]